MRYRRRCAARCCRAVGVGSPNPFSVGRGPVIEILRGRRRRDSCSPISRHVSSSRAELTEGVVDTQHLVDRRRKGLQGGVPQCLRVWWWQTGRRRGAATIDARDHPRSVAQDKTMSASLSGCPSSVALAKNAVVGSLGAAWPGAWRLRSCLRMIRRTPRRRRVRGVAAARGGVVVGHQAGSSSRRCPATPARPSARRARRADAISATASTPVPRAAPRRHRRSRAWAPAQRSAPVRRSRRPVHATAHVQADPCHSGLRAAPRRHTADEGHCGSCAAA